MILAIADRLGRPQAEGFQRVHDLMEATKQAFRVRDAHVRDPASLSVDPSDLIADGEIDRLARRIDRNRSAPWPHPASLADTVWMGVRPSVLSGQSVSVRLVLFVLPFFQ